MKLYQYRFQHAAAQTPSDPFLACKTSNGKLIIASTTDLYYSSDDGKTFTSAKTCDQNIDALYYNSTDDLVYFAAIADATTRAAIYSYDPSDNSVATIDADPYNTYPLHKIEWISTVNGHNCLCISVQNTTPAPDIYAVVICDFDNTLTDIEYGIGTSVFAFVDKDFRLSQPSVDGAVTSLYVYGYCDGSGDVAAGYKGLVYLITDTGAALNVARYNGTETAYSLSEYKKYRGVKPKADGSYDFYFIAGWETANDEDADIKLFDYSVPSYSSISDKGDFIYCRQDYQQGSNIQEPFLYSHSATLGGQFYGFITTGNVSKYSMIYQMSDFTSEIDAYLEDLVFWNGQVWKLKNVESEISSFDVTSEIQNVSSAEMITDISFSNNVIVEMFDDNDVLSFVGTVVEREFGPLGGLYKYHLNSLNVEMNSVKFSEAYTTSIADVIARDFIDDNGSFLYRSSSIDPDGDFSVNRTVEFKNSSLKHALNVLADYEDAIWYVEPDGKIWMQLYASLDACGDTVNQGTNNISNVPKVTLITEQINKVTLYGAYSSGVRLTSTAEDTDAQNIHGIIEYIDHFPHIHDQTQLDNLAAAILAKTGIADNPKYIVVEIKGLDFTQVGKTMSFAFASYSDISSAATYLIVKGVFYAKRNVTLFLLSSGAIQKSRIYGYSIDVKTKMADEEQIDNVGYIADAKMSDLVDDTTPQLGGNLDVNTKSIVFPSVTISDVKDEDDMASNSATMLASQQSIKAFVRAHRSEWDDDDPAAAQIVTGDFTIDGAWHELDMDSFVTVPSGVDGCLCRVYFKDDAVGKKVRFRSTSQSNALQVSEGRTQVANAWKTANLFIPLDSNNKFDYYVDTGMDDLNVVILIWSYLP